MNLCRALTKLVNLVNIQSYEAKGLMIELSVFRYVLAFHKPQIDFKWKS